MTGGAAGTPRARVLETLAAFVAASPARAAHPLRVGIDGVTGAGKSTFARELAAAVAAVGTPAVALSTDDFHHPRAHRRRDADPARGYYRDAFDLVSFRRLVLDPLGAGRPYTPRLHDLATDALVAPAPRPAPHGAVVVVDGTFLQAPALRGAWDVVVWLDTSFPAAERRAVVRDTLLFGGAEAARAAHRERYHAACRLYLDELHPRDSADVVVENDDLAAPALTIRQRPRARSGEAGRDRPVPVDPTAPASAGEPARPPMRPGGRP